ncbi:uncharacterized protein LOC112555798 [Pomacea canaliculata]|uniref:uncharacterized protein LOC112555798 n=1 Tax=Pomacea canaliculata TaxID=400727 RepID=UPI000D73F053|nr:uncharacterized protein LOC112555798 [Pomacea canaliculata]XP_025080101.1 uncharacterized protein LOC112555798 [Pomacea canaliculata]XP_025080102.1 uncharacterized protein LOC112555798 [Pomacea canaliculata]XP_025080103.1 uncharacterized protein LOC112555798 [Pomacea canaliculata]
MGHRQYYYCRRRAHNGFSFHDHDDGEGDGASGKSLKYLTRLLFIAILLSCLVIIITSVLTLVNCRQASRAIEGLIDSSDGHCTSLGLPAYFACVLLLFSVFGFGCLGRRVTGIVLVLVSLAEMALAVVMTLREDCPLPDADATAARLNLTLQQCGLLLPSPNGSVTHVFSEEHVLLQQQLSHSHDTQCLEMASTSTASAACLPHPPQRLSSSTRPSSGTAPATWRTSSTASARRTAMWSCQSC